VSDQKQNSNQEQKTWEPTQEDYLRGLQVAIQEVREARKEQDQSMVILRDTARNMLTIYSSAFSLVTVFRPADSPSMLFPFAAQYAPFFRLASLIMFLLFFICCLLAYSPKTWWSAFVWDYDTLVKDLCKPEIDMLASQLEAYLTAKKNNAGVILARTRLVRMAMLFMVLSVILS